MKVKRYKIKITDINYITVSATTKKEAKDRALDLAWRRIGNVFKSRTTMVVE